MGQRLTASFDELIRNRYGAKAADDPRFALRVEDLFASYYGVPSTSQAPQGSKATSVVLSRTDDGETLRQRGARGRNGQTRARSGQYVAQQSQCGCGTATGGEYVARRAPSTQPVVARQQSMSAAEMAFDECRVDLAEKAAATPSMSPSAPAMPPPPAPPETSRVLQPEVLPPERATASSATEHDFLADMQSILMGQKVFDPSTKKTVDKGPSAPPDRPLPDAKNEQAIFDRIAQSMQYANAYDLGSIDLENRFADFDATSDRQERVAAARKAGNAKAGQTPAAKASAEVGNEEFLRDLDEIRTPPVAAAQSTDGYSRPFYSTGEHVRFGSDLYPDRFRVGRGEGVSFSYGQLIAMGDFYADVDDLLKADPAELKELKALIEQDTAYFTNRSAEKVGTDKWQRVTGKRYLKLADKNYEHFSPNLLFPKTALGRAKRQQGDNKSRWQEHHARAIKEAQSIFLAAPNQSHFFERPLTINAFGDHFLTDAFASGHLINKEFTVALFKSKFMKGSSSLTGKGESFFKRVAEKAWTKGKVAQRFSAHETADYPVCAWGLCLKWHPNIDSAGMLGKLLIKAAEQEPDRVANFAVDALHGYLNETGVEVTNDAGDNSWLLKGDSHLDDKYLPIILRAVQQSVDNINDPGIMASNLNVGAYFERVWKHVPRPTPAGLAQLEQLTNEYTNPDSEDLAESAAALIASEIDSLIDVLVDEHKLQVA